jgi:hypothetical protein
MDLWFREDVVRILASAHETMRATSGIAHPQNPEAIATYHRGFVDALRVVAIAFGVVGPELGARDHDSVASRSVATMQIGLDREK